MFTKKPKRNFNLTEENKLRSLEKKLKKGYSINFRNFRSFYLIHENEEGERIIGRWSNHISYHNQEYTFISKNDDFSEMVNDFKNFCDDNNFSKKSFIKKIFISEIFSEYVKIGNCEFTEYYYYNKNNEKIFLGEDLINKIYFGQILNKN